MPHVQGQRRSPSKMIGGAKSRLESNSIPARDTQRAQTNLVHTRTQRLSQNSVWVSPVEIRVSSGLLQGQRLWVRQTRVWHKPSWRRSPLSHHRAARTYTGWGIQILGGQKQNLVHTRTHEKGAETPQETDPDLPVGVQESPVEVWVGSGLLQGWGH